MLFSDLPLVENPQDSEILVYQDGVASRTTNLVSDLLDQQVVNLVISKSTPNSTLNNHVTNTSIHLPIDDNALSSVSTWSSTKIDSEIAESASWVSLDDIPEGFTNLYFTEERGNQAVLDASLGVPSVNHSSVAASIVAMWQGWSTTEFTYYLEDPSSGSVTITIDGQEYVDEFTVTPGPHNVSVSKNTFWLNNTLAHRVNIESGTDVVITPELTLDAFKEGSINKLWAPDSLQNNAILGDFIRHIDEDFLLHHALPINDNSANTSSTWSSFKIIQYLNQQLSTVSPPTVTKEFAVFSERASSGLHLSGYQWATVNNGNGTYTHRIARIFNRDDYRSNISATSNYYFSLPEPGNWFIWWVANVDINPYFTNVQNVSTYIGEQSNFSSVKLEYPAVLNKYWSGPPYLSLVTQFTCDQDYNVAYKDNWLVPKSVSGRYEVYSQIHFEKIT
jgi:hypothetical protein